MHIPPPALPPLRESIFTQVAYCAFYTCWLRHESNSHERDGMWHAVFVIPRIQCLPFPYWTLSFLSPRRLIEKGEKKVKRFTNESPPGSWGCCSYHVGLVHLGWARSIHYFGSITYKQYITIEFYFVPGTNNPLISVRLYNLEQSLTRYSQRQLRKYDPRI